MTTNKYMIFMTESRLFYYFYHISAITFHIKLHKIISKQEKRIIAEHLDDSVYTKEGCVCG